MKMFEILSIDTLKKKKSWLSVKFSYYEFIPCGNDKFKDKTVTITKSVFSNFQNHVVS